MKPAGKTDPGEGVCEIAGKRILEGPHRLRPNKKERHIVRRQTSGFAKGIDLGHFVERGSFSSRAERRAKIKPGVLADQDRSCIITVFMAPIRLGILGSGKGSNFAAILRAIQAGDLEAEAAVVVSDVPGAGILALAEAEGIPTHTLREPRYKSRLSPEVEDELVRVLQAAKVDLVVLAGYMRVVKAPLLEAFPRRVVNIHPSLLPDFRGLEAWRQALEAGAAKTGCTVHFVDSGLDTGEILAQSEVPVEPGDTPESLHARIQAAEHHLYPAVIRQLAKENR